MVLPLPALPLGVEGDVPVQLHPGHIHPQKFQGGSETFTRLLENAGLESPFEPHCLQAVCEKAGRWLAAYDLTGIL